MTTILFSHTRRTYIILSLNNQLESSLKLTYNIQQHGATCRAVKTFFNSRLIMNSRRLWNSHQRRTFLRAEASRDILKFRVSEIASPGVFNRYFPPRTPCCFVGIHARLEAMPSKCPRRSTTSHGSNVSQIWSCLNMRSMSFKTGKRMLHNFIRWCLFFLAVMTHLW